MKYKTFALTVKYNCKPDMTVHADMYNQVWELFALHHVKISHMVDELDSRRRLHYHAVADVPSSLFRKKLILPKFHILLLPLNTQDDLARWIKYIYKDVDPKDWPKTDLPDPSNTKKFTKNLFKCCNENKVSL